MTTTNGNGETLQYTYDPQGRLSALTLPDTTTETYTHTADGLVSTATDARGTTAFSYDATTRRLTRVTEPDGRYVRYEYDTVGNRTMMAHALSAGSAEEITQYAYDALNRMVRVIDPSGGVTTYTYDAVGNQTAIVRPNGATTAFTYDSRNRLTGEVHKDGGGATLAGFTYTLDPVGNRTRVQHADGSRVEYDYDATSKVTAERHFDASGALTGSIGYSYDAVGNLVSRTGSLGTATYTYNANNQLTAGDGLTYAYDAAGNLLSATDTLGAIARYTWDPRGRLKQFQPPLGGATTYTYDFRGLRQSKSGPGGVLNFLTDRANATGVPQVARESDAGGTTLRSYVYGSRLLSQTQAGATAYYHADGLGSTRLLTNPGGTPTDTYTYAAYGPLLAQTGASPNAYLFAGEQQDAESGLYYLRARYYDPQVGRFLSRDPADGDEQVPLSLHKYLYAHANPMNLTDPSGRQVPTSLLELTQTIKTQFLQRREQLRTLIKATDKTARTAAQVAEFLAKVFTVLSVVEFDTGLHAIAYFGENPFSRKSAQGALLGLAIDMFKRDTKFSLNFTGCEPQMFAFVDLKESPPVPSKKAVIHICAGLGGFLSLPPLPVPSLRPSMVGAMVHEFTHITLRTNDPAYGCVGAAGLARTGPLVPAVVALDNADNYRCFVEAVAIHEHAEIIGDLLGP